MSEGYDHKTKTGFVLGAGFTKAFLPDAPLMEDDYDGQWLLEQFREFPYMRNLIDLELSTPPEGKIDIERLMTRLDSAMPYDLANIPYSQLNVLMSMVKQCFRQKLDEAMKGNRDDAYLKDFAPHCVNGKIGCVAFNYDDLLDHALSEVQKSEANDSEWFIDTGYGFICRGSKAYIWHGQNHMDRSSMFLLKLHGSVNWYPKGGYPKPYTLDAIVHHERWLPETEQLQKISWEVTERHLEPDPFIVPPVLVKSDLAHQPILRKVWELAYEELSKADQVAFIGYSLPQTDMAAAFLFRETLFKRRPAIHVVNFAENETDKETIRKRYRVLFPWLKDEDFDFRGALVWARELVQRESAL
jgi:hypothetical protein